MTRGHYFVIRLLQLPAVLLLISLSTFLIIRLVPGDPVTVMLGPYASPELHDKLMTYYGFDRPWPDQYGRWIGRALRGDLGKSVRTGEQVAPLIPRRLLVSSTLAALTIALTTLIAIPVGVVAAAHHDTLIDYATMLLTFLALSIPNFVLAVILILVVGVHFHWLPIAGVGNQPILSLRTLELYVMPAIALAAGRIAFIARLLRSSLLDVLSLDYIKVARAKGLMPRVVLMKHALRNSMIPLITLVATEFAYLLGGVVIIEEIFVIPGMGNLLVRAVSQRDLPVVQGIILVVALVFIVSSLFADFCYLLVDPRVRYG